MEKKTKNPFQEGAERGYKLYILQITTNPFLQGVVMMD